MSTLVDAYDTRTGEKLPHRVRRAAVGHPAIAPHLSLTPPSRTKKKAATEAAATETPATGENEETSHAHAR